MYIKGFIVGVVLVILIFCLLVFGARCWLDYKRECLADERLQVIQSVERLPLAIWYV